MLRGYQRSWLRGDLIAGVTVAAYLVPQVMAYATVAGLPPVAGLWAALPALVVYALLGSSRSLSMGPEATTALMTAIAIGPLAAGDPARYAVLAATLALLVGRDVTGGLAAAAGIRGRPAVAAGPGRLHGGRGTDHDRRPARPGHRRASHRGEASSHRSSHLPAAWARSSWPRSRSPRRSWPSSSWCAPGGRTRLARCWPCVLATVAVVRVRPAPARRQRGRPDAGGPAGPGAARSSPG